ncbi:MAG: leucine-rich repeat domain-containing protein [Bacteroidales bacterium]|nr:leucine-rich repeat domain-containing protein [Bacteroidales bacterium]
MAATSVMAANALTVNNPVAGQLSHNISSTDGVTELVLSGRINAADLYFVSEAMPALTSLNLRNATIEAYRGVKLKGSVSYPEATIPRFVFSGSRLQSLTLPVTPVSIGEGAFAGSDLRSVTLPSTVVTVADGAFTGCPQLASVTVSCAELGSGTFAGSPKLTTVTITNNVELGVRSFAGCTGLQTVNGSDKVTVVGDRAFADCPSLRNFTFGPVLTEIGDEAFTAAGLKNINLENCRQLQTVGDWAFAKMPELVSVRMGAVPNVGEGIVFHCPALTEMRASTTATAVPDYAYVDDTKMDTTYMLSPQTTDIGDYALANMTQVETLVLPSTVESIGSYAMKDMTGLKSLTVSSDGVPALGDNVWDGVDQPKAILYVPTGDKEAYEAADQWKEFTIVEGVTGVDDAVIPETVAGLRGRFVGDELQVSIDGVEIERLSLYDTAGVLLVSLEPMSDMVCVDTEGMSTRIYIVSALLGDGRTATLKLAK